MVGLIDSERHITTQWFKKDGDAIFLVGEIGNEIGGSQFLKVCHGLKQGPLPVVDLAHEIKVQTAVRDLIHQGLVKSAHDCSEGGLAVALAECCFNPERLFGAEINLAHASGLQTDQSPKLEAWATLFNESQSRIVISIAAADLERTMSTLGKQSIPFHQLGKVAGNELRISVNEETFRWPLVDLHDDWFNAIRRVVEDETERIPSL
jgi:phosphoribosylformylglycinamidine synthase